MRRPIILPALLLLFAHAVAAQTIHVVDDAKLPRFEAASVKPGDPKDSGGMIGLPPGRFVQQNNDMFNALNIAFGVKPYQMPQPLPGVLAERWSIDARMPEGEPVTARALMLRALLVDRFKLRYHVDTRQEDGYALVLARRDGTLGPQLRPGATDCAARRDPQRRADDLPPLPAGVKPCGINNNRGVLDLGGVAISTLVGMLSNQTGKTVIDKTGLSGYYDVDLHWSPALASALRADPNAPDVDGPSLFTAVQEQLGLKLEPAKAPVDHLVIDHIERPEPD